MLEVELTKEFEYEALKSGGGETSGTLAAKNKTDAIKQIREMGLFPTKLTEVKHPETHSSYFEYLSELLGNKLIDLGKKLKGEKNV